MEKFLKCRRRGTVEEPVFTCIRRRQSRRGLLQMQKPRSSFRPEGRREEKVYKKWSAGSNHRKKRAHFDFVYRCDSVIRVFAELPNVWRNAGQRGTHEAACCRRDARLCFLTKARPSRG